MVTVFIFKNSDYLYESFNAISRKPKISDTPLEIKWIFHWVKINCKL